MQARIGGGNFFIFVFFVVVVVSVWLLHSEHVFLVCEETEPRLGLFSNLLAMAVAFIHPLGGGGTWVLEM